MPLIPRFRFRHLPTLILLVYISGMALAQANDEMQISNEPPKVRFTTLPPRLRSDLALTAAASIPLTT